MLASVSLFAVRMTGNAGVIHQGLLPANPHTGIAIEKTYILVFKITGMTSIEDAKIIDGILIKTPYLINASTSFEKGLCKIETHDPSNADKIKEVIYSCRKTLGHSIAASLIETYEAKE